MASERVSAHAASYRLAVTTRPSIALAVGGIAFFGALAALHSSPRWPPCQHLPPAT